MTSPHIILYGRPFCPLVGPVRRTLQWAKADFHYVDIATDAQARAQVLEINDGYESVPTLEFPDGSTLTEPSSNELKVKLKALGYDVPTPTPRQRVQSYLENPLIRFVGLLLLADGIFSSNSLLIVVGAVILGLVLLAGRLSVTPGHETAVNDG